MRDRETDSWWSIMSSDAIGGQMKGAELVELPISEKTTWKDWRRRHPKTLVLSIDGKEHEARNRYDDYFASADTFEDLAVEDDRLAPKDSIYSFFLDETPYAVAHATVEGGRLFPLEDGRRLFIYREPGAPMFASSRAWLAGATLDELDGSEEIHAALEAGGFEGAAEIGGFDTFWYSWVVINRETRLLQ